MAVSRDSALYKQLGELKLIDEAKLDALYEQAQAQKISFADLLLKNDLISDENLGKITADILAAPYIRLSKVSIDQEILKLIPQIVAKKQQVIVFGKDQKGLKLATTNPQDTQILDFISKKTGEKVTPYYATARDIAEAINNYQKTLQKSFEDLLANEVKTASSGQSPETPVAKIVDLLIAYAYANKASDIHIEPLETSSLVRFRIDGVLHDVISLPRPIHDQIISRIKILAKLRTDEHLNAQDGKMQAKLEEENLY